MKALILESTDETPKVVLDNALGTFEISGKSLPEDVTTFYDPILSWLDEYAQTPNDETVFKFQMLYFNTASSKLIMDILLKLEDMQGVGANVRVEWYYQENDEDMQEAGQEFSEIAEVPFQFLAL